MVFGSHNHGYDLSGEKIVRSKSACQIDILNSQIVFIVRNLSFVKTNFIFLHELGISIINVYKQSSWF